MQGAVLFVNCHLFVVLYFCKLFITMNISFVLVKIWRSVWIHPLNLKVTLVGKICLEFLLLFWNQL